MTGVGAVVNTAKVLPGGSVAVFGLGGIGLSAILGARISGAHPIMAIDIVPAKLQTPLKLGATHAIDATAEDPVKAIKELTRGGVDYAFDASGHEQALTQAYWATRPGGKTVAIGIPHPSKHFSVPVVSIVGEERTVLGSYMGSCIPRRDIPRFLGLYQAGHEGRHTLRGSFEMGKGWAVPISNSCWPGRLGWCNILSNFSSRGGAEKWRGSSESVTGWFGPS